MKRIKDFSKVKVRPDMLFCKVHMKKESKIIIPEEVQDKGQGFDYVEVISVGNKIDDVEVGDIILDIDGSMTTYKLEDVTYGRVARHICGLIVSPDNFEK